MRNKLISQLEVLQNIHSCYNYFLASYEAMQMPQAVLDIKSNRTKIFFEIQELKKLISAMPIISLDNEQETTINHDGEIAFYSDKRFKLTE